MNEFFFHFYVEVLQVLNLPRHSHISIFLRVVQLLWLYATFMKNNLEKLKKANTD